MVPVYHSVLTILVAVIILSLYHVMVVDVTVILLVIYFKTAVLILKVLDVMLHQIIVHHHPVVYHSLVQ